MERRQLRRILARWEVPVPAGHAKRNKGLSFVFVDPSRAAEAKAALVGRLGEPAQDTPSATRWVEPDGASVRMFHGDDRDPVVAVGV
jgi:hypothetical protein